MEVILRDGSVDLTVNPEEGTPVAIVPNIPIRFTMFIPPALGSPDWLVGYIVQADQPAPPFEYIAESAMANYCPAGFTWEKLVEPTKPYLWCRFVTSASMNFGAVTFIGIYEAMSDAIYNQLMKGKQDLDKVLVRLARQKTQLEDKIAQGVVEETEILEGAYQLYSNFLSDEIAAYEALNP